MTKSNENNNYNALVHTPDTVKQLEMLAAASQSKRCVLLEGDTCSRKTALVREALKALIQRESSRRLAALGGTMPELEDIPRRRVSGE